MFKNSKNLVRYNFRFNYALWTLLSCFIITCYVLFNFYCIRHILSKISRNDQLFSLFSILISFIFLFLLFFIYFFTHKKEEHKNPKKRKEKK